MKTKPRCLIDVLTLEGVLALLGNRRDGGMEKTISEEGSKGKGREAQKRLTAKAASAASSLVACGGRAVLYFSPCSSLR